MRGGFNRPLPGLSTSVAFSVGNWNARGLLHHKRKVRHKKLTHLLYEAKKHAVMVVEEVHGSFAQVMAALHRFSQLFHLFYSPCTQTQAADFWTCPRPRTVGNFGHAPALGQVSEGIPCDDSHDVVLPCTSANYNFSAGGVLFLASKKHFSGWSLDFQVVVPGRVAILNSFKYFENLLANKYFHTVGVHNHGISSRQMSKIENATNPKIRKAKLHPNLVCLALVGDLNLSAPGESPLELAHPVPMGPLAGEVNRIPPTRVHESRWNNILSQMIEIKTKMQTHFNMSTLKLS